MKVDEIIREEGFQPEKGADFGNKFLTGNGYLGVRGTMDEAAKEQMAAVNLAGVYDRHGSGWREPLNAPNPLYVRITADGVPYSLPETVPEAHAQNLDIGCGLQGRETHWRIPGGILQIRSERFCSMENVHLLCLRYTVRVSRSTEIELISGIDGDVWNINGPHYVSVETGCEGGVLRALAASGESGIRVGAAQSIKTDFEYSEEFPARERQIFRVLHFSAEADRDYTLTVFAAVFTSKDCADPLSAAMETALRARTEGYEAAKGNHSAKWETLWEGSRVLIDGDPAAQEALDYSIYHLHCIAPRDAKSRSIPARGLSGQTYKGAVFWDTEMFLFDFFLYTEPETAKSLLRYRIETLEGARKKAAEYGFAGAFYAWESQEGGFDACSDYNVTDVFTGRPVRTYFRDKQVHISAAVVYAVMKYLRATNDCSVLTEGAAEVVIECARFYRSLLLRRADSERYEIRDVLGPDEYHERVNNNAYTNRMARFVFSYAIEVIDRLRADFSAAYEQLNKAFNLAGEQRKFRDAAEHLFIPAPREKDGVIEQFDGYFNLEDTTPAELTKRLLNEHEYWGAGSGVASQTQVIKQADVVTMLSLFHEDYSAEVLKSNWDYYEPRTEHGSSLSACMYALLACRLGEADLAYPFFLKSAQTDLKGGGKQWAGSVYIGGTHPAAAGGAWMTAIEGFAGFSPESSPENKKSELVLSSDDTEFPVFIPCLPEGWERMRFPLRWRGALYRVEVTRQGCHIEKVPEGF